MVALLESRSIVPLPGEIWKDIPSTHGYYQASNFGRIRRVVGWKNRGYCTCISLRPDSGGYRMVRLKIAGRLTEARVHALVAEAFLGTRPTGLVVNHKDGCKTNNTVENLEYVTPAENAQHAFAMGLVKVPSRHWRKAPGASSQFMGVLWHRKSRCWMAQIRSNKTKRHLGSFKSEHKAALAYLRARVEHDLSMSGRAGSDSPP